MTETEDVSCCPKCDCKSLGEAELRGDAGLYPRRKFFASRARLFAKVCLSCGEVFSWKVDKPEKFGD